jgi:hypothetical protein
MVSWVITPCRQEGVLQLEGIYRLLLQGRRVSHVRNPKKQAANSAGFLLGLLFDPEDRSDMFLLNVGLSPNYTGLQHRGPKSYIT